MRARGSLLKYSVCHFNSGNFGKKSLLLSESGIFHSGVYPPWSCSRDSSDIPDKLAWHGHFDDSPRQRIHYRKWTSRFASVKRRNLCLGLMPCAEQQRFLARINPGFEMIRHGCLDFERRAGFSRPLRNDNSSICESTIGKQHVA